MIPSGALVSRACPVRPHHPESGLLRERCCLVRSLEILEILGDKPVPLRGFPTRLHVLLNKLRNFESSNWNHQSPGSHRQRSIIGAYRLRAQDLVRLELSRCDCSQHHAGLGFHKYFARVAAPVFKALPDLDRLETAVAPRRSSRPPPHAQIARHPDACSRAGYRGRPPPDFHPHLHGPAPSRAPISNKTTHPAHCIAALNRLPTPSHLDSWRFSASGTPRFS